MSHVVCIFFQQTFTLNAFNNGFWGGFGFEEKIQIWGWKLVLAGLYWAKFWCDEVLQFLVCTLVVQQEKQNLVDSGNFL